MSCCIFSGFTPVVDWLKVGPLCSSPQLAEVKVKIFEAKQSLEECIAAQEFSRASELKDSITELENLKNQLMKEAEEPEMKEVRVEKVGLQRACAYSWLCH